MALFPVTSRPPSWIISNDHISAVTHSIHLYSAHRMVIFAIAQLSCLLLEPISMFLSQDLTVKSDVRRINGAASVERDSPPPGTFPRKSASTQQYNGKQAQVRHGHFIPDQASDIAMRIKLVFYLWQNMKLSVCHAHFTLHVYLTKLYRKEADYKYIIRGFKILM